MELTPTTTRQLVDKLFSLQWCRENLVVPINTITNGQAQSQIITIAIGNFSYLATIGEFIKKRAAENGYECQIVEKPANEIQSLLDQAAEERLISGDSISETEFSDDAILDALKEAEDDNQLGFNFDFDDSEEENIEDIVQDLSLEMLGSKIQQAAAKILIHACRSNVSDIHVEPRHDDYNIRVRRDGVMQNYVKIPRSAGIKLTACLKNMAKMDIAERRASQDGKIKRRFEGQTMEFRCATAPGKYGEKMVMRILNSNSEMLSLDLLISNDNVREQFRSIINESNGIIIVSGPTGSGKSTTLASALREKDTGELNIVTAEDPIEYDLGGNIQQFPVVRAKGQTFANLLRTFLRQDPDVILIGETRDPETAESSMDAAETGHLVFTTLHANSAASSLTRLMDMEVPSYKLNASLRGVLAQRLLRKVCPECSAERPINEAESQFTGIQLGTNVRVATSLKAEDKQQRKQEGSLCTRCSGTGYQGRIGTYELMKVNRNIRDAIKQQKSNHEIEEIAVEDGMLTLKSYAVDLIKKQLTTISELKKICNTEH
ncbi:type II/IV secretion system family protein [Synechococcus sp. PROS-7-1]|uniref:GspE/PulE family protein n=1 Tax=Synechococcus sp. PROS-7-1 TaxID=1442556 RepID=UPI0016497322|nr:GspE/PulE family protein [Synechococcus sp. PROS-7-1]QNI86425.1 type II/IV secretion system family protein [Synechococcus sp. PROS-7-1]